MQIKKNTLPAEGNFTLSRGAGQSDIQDLVFTNCLASIMVKCLYLRRLCGSSCSQWCCYATWEGAPLSTVVVAVTVLTLHGLLADHREGISPI